MNQMPRPAGWEHLVTLNIPTKFWSDHSLRHQDREWDGPSGWPIKHGKLITTVEFSRDELDCLREDCENMIAYGRNGEYEGDVGLGRLVESAKRTLAVIEKYEGVDGFVAG